MTEQSAPESYNSGEIALAFDEPFYGDFNWKQVSVGMKWLQNPLVQHAWTSLQNDLDSQLNSLLANAQTKVVMRKLLDYNTPSSELFNPPAGRSRRQMQTVLLNMKHGVDHDGFQVWWEPRFFSGMKLQCRFSPDKSLVEIQIAIRLLYSADNYGSPKMKIDICASMMISSREADRLVAPAPTVCLPEVAAYSLSLDEPGYSRESEMCHDPPPSYEQIQQTIDGTVLSTAPTSAKSPSFFSHLTEYLCIPSLPRRKEELP